MKYKELRGKKLEELNSMIVELRQELAKERAKNASGAKVENPGKMKKLRKDIAKVLTEINARMEVVK